MSQAVAPAPRLGGPGRALSRSGPVLGRGLLGIYLSIIVLLPIAALLAHIGDPASFWRAISSREARSAIELTIVASLIVALINAVMGTLIAWVLVRDSFRGQQVVNSVIDLPFALPTVVAGLVLLALYGHGGVDIGIVGTRAAVVLALLFVTLPFTVRAVQPVLIELDPSMEEAAASLGARPPTIWWRIILPNLMPAIVSGAALSFARALGEFGSINLISGDLPNKTEVASVYIFNLATNAANTAGGIQTPAAISVFLLLVAILVLAVMSLLTRGRRRRRA
jgi:sulfate transport system permease protein